MKQDLEQELELAGWKLDQFARLGLDIIDATDAIANGVDWHDLDHFLATYPRCSPKVAKEILT